MMPLNASEAPRFLSSPLRFRGEAGENGQEEEPRFFRRIATSTVAIGLLLSACSNASNPPQDTSPVSTPATTPAQQSPGETVSETTISITLNGRSLTARLSDNPAARSLLDQLPLHQEFTDYGGQEVQTRLPRPLTTDGMPRGESAPAGTIGYYAPEQALVLYYRDVGRFDGIMRLGRIEGDPASLAGWEQAKPVTIERAD